MTWPVAEGEFARAVVAATQSSLRLQLYNFEGNELPAPVRLWRLRPGKYQWKSTDARQTPVSEGEFTVSRRAQVIHLPLPAQTEITIVIRRR